MKSIKTVSLLTVIIQLSLCSWAFAEILPHKLHFIWMGDSINSEYLDNIVAFSKANPDYEVKIWTDQPNLFSELASSIKRENFDRLFHSMPNKLLEYFRHETLAIVPPSKEKLFPNYAAGSDLLRIQVLKLEGGIYLDTDISIQDEEEGSGKFGDIDAPLGYVIPINVTTGKYNNHMIGVVQGHEVLLQAEKAIEEKYSEYLKEPHIAKNSEFYGSKYGMINEDGTSPVLHGKIHAGNFWSLKLGSRGAASYCRYLLTHNITGFELFDDVFLPRSQLRQWYEKFIGVSAAEVSNFDLAKLIKFPEIKNIHHDNKVLWATPKSNVKD